MSTVINFPCDVICRVTCSVCGAARDIPLGYYYAGMSLPSPSFPEGWQVFDHIMICQDHKIDIFGVIDGKSGRFSRWSSITEEPIRPIWVPDKGLAE